MSSEVKNKTVDRLWSVNGVSEVINSQAATCLSYNWDQTWSVFYTLEGSGQYIDYFGSEIVTYVCMYSRWNADLCRLFYS